MSANEFPVESILATIGFSAIVSAIISSLVTHFLTKSRVKSNRYVVALTEKLDLYSFMIYHIDSMKLKAQALNIQPQSGTAYAYTPTELQDKIQRIDAKISGSLYLLKYDILKEWVFVKTLYSQVQVVPHVDRLRDLLVREYMESIVPEYEKVVGDIAEEIPAS